MNISPDQLRYLQLLARDFPNIATASTEIINLQAILNLPKGTEHFLADLHGEYEAFQHVLRNASGAIKRKVKEIYNETLSSKDQKELCTLIYYPELKLELVKQNTDDMKDWYFVSINRLVKVCRNVSSKYSRSKVLKALPKDFSYIIQELLHESTLDPNKQAYVDVIVRTIIDIDRADDFIVAICNLIQQLTIDKLHILGDVFDRGPSPDRIMDILCNYHNFDIQWGNHDILWMGAASGNDCCIANVIRITLRYANQSVLQDGYGINILPLATFAMATYGDDRCSQFIPKELGEKVGEKDSRLIGLMHKAITIIQLKLEGNMIMRHPEYGMDNRLLLNHINYDKGTVTLDGKEYPLRDTFLPTIDPKNPYQLTDEEQAIVDSLHKSFVRSEKLKRHMKCLFRHGCVFTIINSNLLFHASIPLNADGTLKDVEIRGEKYRGKALFYKVGSMIREAYFGSNSDDQESYKYSLDYDWYLWCGPDSPVFDKDKMATFEDYFIEDKQASKETKGNYYALRDNEKVCDYILDEFGVTGQHRHIINGHVPVRTLQGEQPIKANGKMMVIDGGFSKAYQPKTGIAGYTLVYHSRGFQLVMHEPFTSIEKAVAEGQDIKSTTQVVEMSAYRMHVKDTDIGKEIIRQIADLQLLLSSYRSGLISEKEYKRVTNKE
ncbi:MAG: fructose-1,6-bisphosphatase [Muribaculaceae bacterium]